MTPITEPVCIICIVHPKDAIAKGWVAVGPFRNIGNRQVWLCPSCGADLTFAFGGTAKKSKRRMTNDELLALAEEVRATERSLADR